jgi:hypothetical protein
VIVRDHEAELHFFFLDPCNLHPGEEQIVLEQNAGRTRAGALCVRADRHAVLPTRCAPSPRAATGRTDLPDDESA